MKRDVVEYYTRRAPTYSDLDKPNTIVSCVRAIGVMDHLRIIAPMPGEKILDMGCGPGRFLGPFSVADVVGVDFTPDMLMQAKRWCKKLVRGDAEHLPFKDGAFDIVHSAGLLGVYRSKKILAEAVRVAKKGGWVYVSFPAASSVSGLMVRLFRGIYNPSLMDFWYTKEEIVEMLPQGIRAKSIFRLGWEPPFQRLYRRWESDSLVRLFVFLEKHLKNKPLFRYFSARFLLEGIKE